MDGTLGAKREIRRLAEYLWEGEVVRHMVSGTYAAGTGLVVLTDRRLLFVRDGWTSKTTEDFPLDKISSVQWHSGMLMGKLTVFASGNKADITNVGKQGGKIIADTIRERLASGPSYPPQPPTPPAPAAMAQQPAPLAPPAAPEPAPAPAVTGDAIFDALERLGKLRDAGVLTVDEFEAKKKDLLDRL
ncbi:PH domain-containing protein [Actinomadura gamaensis]|uniref:PH domain-containing protein n=1 Tax=Actinomadura gamaensis TaxID=1763541 RepID=A0ABV9U866_9ACTN